MRWYTPTANPATACGYVRRGADLKQLSHGDYQRHAIYRANDIEQYGKEDEPVNVTAPGMRWRPIIPMPQWTSCVILEIVSVRASG